MRPIDSNQLPSPSCRLLTGASVILVALVGACDPELVSDGLPDDHGVGATPVQTLKDDAVAPLAPTCSGLEEPVELAPGSVVLAQGKETLVVTTPTEDPVLKIGGATTTKYTCTCEAQTGSCTPNMQPNFTVDCMPSGCATETGGACKLNSSAKFDFDVARDVVERRSCESGSYDMKVVGARTAQLADSMKNGEIAAAKFSKDGSTATAPAGHGLVAEHVGGLWIVYAIGSDRFDGDGNLKTGVGPAATNPVVQLAGGTKAKCFCGGSGNCSFSGGSFGLCQGNCFDAQQQSQCTIEIKSK